MVLSKSLKLDFKQAFWQRMNVIMATLSVLYLMQQGSASSVESGQEQLLLVLVSDKTLFKCGP